MAFFQHLSGKVSRSCGVPCGPLPLSRTSASLGGNRKQRSAWGAVSPGCRAEMLAQTLQADSLHDGVQANKCCLLTELIS